MEETPNGTPVGVDDPYAYVERCDFLTADGCCRFAFDHADRDQAFARDRRAEDFRCPAADPDGEWAWDDCPHFRSRAPAGDRECTRCGLAERRNAHNDELPLLEEHHLSYQDGETLSHEITVFLCRWCHAKVHQSWARIDDDVSPDPEAVAASEGRRARERAEADFKTARDRYDR